MAKLYYQQTDPDIPGSWSWQRVGEGERIGVVPESTNYGEYGAETVGPYVAAFGEGMDEFGFSTTTSRKINSPLYETYADYQADPFQLGNLRYTPTLSDTDMDALRQIVAKTPYEGAKSAEQMVYERFLEQNGPAALPAGIGGQYKSAFVTPDAGQGWGQEYEGVALRARASSAGALYDILNTYMGAPGFVEKYGKRTPDELGLKASDIWASGQSMWDQYINSQMANQFSFVRDVLPLVSAFILPPALGQLATLGYLGSAGGVVGSGGLTNVVSTLAQGALGGLLGGGTQTPTLGDASPQYDNTPAQVEAPAAPAPAQPAAAPRVLSTPPTRPALAQQTARRRGGGRGSTVLTGTLAEGL